MASKNAGRLAGLAALAGAAYLANEKFKDKDKGASTTPAKDTAAENNRIADARDARDAENAKSFTMSNEDEGPAPYSNEGRIPNRFAARPKAPSASAAKKPAPSASDSRAPSSNEGRTPGTLFNPRPDPRDAEAGNSRGTRAVAVGDGGKKKIDERDGTFKRGGKVKKMASGGSASSASRRADGIATKGKTRGRVL